MGKNDVCVDGRCGGVEFVMNESYFLLVSGGKILFLVLFEKGRVFSVSTRLAFTPGCSTRTGVGVGSGGFNVGLGVLRGFRRRGSLICELCGRILEGDGTEAR